ncbi:unnamed protein product [Darwinula stevensoni]|uniref:START domain-containing protein n=1 Tax=Darwinula stevensoni TaxID=69355 RepID=A0A7R8XKB0_9CRUS|nr:unnamed protein product [Darwinula stevensoni]CAG0895562.1 unnamed protein product [Darwinula stevensoni]
MYALHRQVDLLPYVNQGESAFHEVKNLMDNGVWDLGREEDGIIIKSLYSRKYNNYIFLTETVVNASAEDLIEEYWWHFERIPTWNTAASSMEVIKVDLLPYVNQGESAFHEVKDLMDNGVWDLEREEDGIIIKSLYSRKYNNYIFLTETVVNASAEDLIEEYWWHFERIPTWNTAASSMEVIKRISKTKMIARVIGAHLGSQYISRRDFVAVYSRHGVLDTQRMVEDFYMCFISTEFPGAPPEGEYVRATYHPSGFRFSPNGDGSATFQYLLNVDVKINALMKALSRVAMIPTMAEYATQLRNYASTLKKA